MSAKSQFLERIASLERSLFIEAVSDKADKAHNDVANLLRNGLAVVGFAALEDFIKTRTSEVLDEIGTTPVPFNNLPEKLRYAVTFEALSSLNYQMSLIEKGARVSYIQDHAQKIASTATATYELSTQALGYDQANVNAETIKAILKCFLITDPWGKMTVIASNLGLTALPLEETYINAARRRHKAAHAPHANTPQNDIAQYVKEAYAIAISFDALLSKALSKLHQNDKSYLTGLAQLTEADIQFRFLKYAGSQWKEYKHAAKRASSISTDLNAILPLVKNKASTNEEVFVQYDERNKIMDWECF